MVSHRDFVNRRLGDHLGGSYDRNGLCHSRYYGCRERLLRRRHRRELSRRIKSYPLPPTRLSQLRQHGRIMRKANPPKIRGVMIRLKPSGEGSPPSVLRAFGLRLGEEAKHSSRLGVSLQLQSLAISKNCASARRLGREVVTAASRCGVMGPVCLGRLDPVNLHVLHPPTTPIIRGPCRT